MPCRRQRLIIIFTYSNGFTFAVAPTLTHVTRPFIPSYFPLSLAVFHSPDVLRMNLILLLIILFAAPEKTSPRVVLSRQISTHTLTHPIEIFNGQKSFLVFFFVFCCGYAATACHSTTEHWHISICFDCLVSHSGAFHSNRIVFA